MLANKRMVLAQVMMKIIRDSTTAMKMLTQTEVASTAVTKKTCKNSPKRKGRKLTKRAAKRRREVQEELRKVKKELQDEKQQKLKV